MSGFKTAPDFGPVRASRGRDLVARIGAFQAPHSGSNPDGRIPSVWGKTKAPGAVSSYPQNFGWGG